MENLNTILNGDTVTTSKFEGEWEVRYINRSEGWLEVSDEEDTVRHILYPQDITSYNVL